MPLINTSSTAYYLDADGEIVEGEAGQVPDPAVTLLVAPGGSLDDGEAKAFGIADKLTPVGDVTFFHGITGEEILLRGNRAIAPHLAAPLPGTRLRPVPARQVVRVGGKDEGGDVPGRQSGALAAPAVDARGASAATRTVEAVGPARAAAPGTESKAVRPGADTGIENKSGSAAPAADPAKEEKPAPGLTFGKGDGGKGK
jgi:hypothetical protein